MSVWSAVVGGFVGTLVLTTAVAGASELGLTRMDLPFLLGTAFTANRVRAKVIGYIVHFIFGLLFALAYWVVFSVTGRAGWAFGLVLGVVHALFDGTVLVNVLLPSVHPLMGTPASAADQAPLLEAPGFMLLNYGRGTPIVGLIGHMAYGVIVGTIVQMAAD